MNSNVINEEWENINLDYEGENKFASFFSSQGNIHSYPAKAVPEMISDLLIKLKNMHKIKTVLDPFVGSGTTALEAKYLGLDFYGSDLNPLAVMLAMAKTLTINNTIYTKKHLTEFVEEMQQGYGENIPVALENFKNIDYWFKDNNIRELSYIKYEIDKFIRRSKNYKRIYSLILLTAFSSTIRRVSLTRNGEFKLYRMSINDIEKYNINALEVFKEKVENLLDMLVAANNSYKQESICEIYLKNAKNLNYLENEKIDLIITSPPYGDSQSTVAYGQFSRLSIQWMSDLMLRYLNIESEHDNCDQYLLGGKRSNYKLNEIDNFYESKTIRDLIFSMDEVIKRNLRERNNASDIINNLMESMESNDYLYRKSIHLNDIVYSLIKERVRLDTYRKIVNGASKLEDKKIKKLSKEQSELFMHELLGENNKRKYKRLMQLRDKLPYVREAINRNIQSLPKRKEEVIDFFKDLYKVVLETNRVLANNGVQVWIVGHRTVLGEINVNMHDILEDWFINMGYSVITSLERKYSFKRMPHHINSTITRKNKVNTMMYEYILIVRKNNFGQS